VITVNDDQDENSTSQAGHDNDDYSYYSNEEYLILIVLLSIGCFILVIIAGFLLHQWYGHKKYIK